VKDADTNNVVLQFIAYNGFGNNLYIDNVSVGNRYTNDVSASSIGNIPADTNYSYFGNSSFKISPSAEITNTGRNNINSPFSVTMKVTPGNYTSSRSVQSLNSGRTVNLSFDSLTMYPGTGFNISLFTSLSNDENRSNDTIRQYTYFLPGVRRNVLFESFTSATCGPCALENPPLDSFITQRFDSIVAVKFHMSWPPPGNDPMYLANPVQNTDRRYYYGISAVPNLFIDGLYKIVSGYNTLSNLTTPFYNRLATGSPLSISVIDTRIAGDSIKSNVTLNILSPLGPGNFYLRVYAVERVITYQTPPGTNGETVFYDVFRRAYPSSTGTPVPTAVGVYNFEFRYKRESAWVDSMIYTAAFVQNDINKEVLNCAKARHYASSYKSVAGRTGKYQFVKPVPIRNENSVQNVIQLRTDLKVQSGFLLEMFDWFFPPAGWSVVNPDSGVTFSQFTGANGPSFGGLKCVKMDFFNYENLGQADYMYSRLYNDVQPDDSIKFDWAYAQFPTYSDDRLVVKVSTDGGITFPFTIFDRNGAALATAPPHIVGFVPASDSEWGTFATTLENIISVRPISNNYPSEYKLFQNYPNPFNPTTRIKFDIRPPLSPLLGKEGTGVVLKIYDILGREVTTLVNEQLKPGTYEVDFNGTNYPTGIYFYRLTSGEYTLTQRMVLLK
jgi:hypothetical protein